MTDYVSDAPPGGSGPSRYPPASKWVGWIAFAGVLMVILGTLHALQGLVAIFKDEYFLVSPSGLAVKLDFTAWGWIALIVASSSPSPGCASWPARCGRGPSGWGWRP